MMSRKMNRPLRRPCPESGKPLGGIGILFRGRALPHWVARTDFLSATLISKNQKLPPTLAIFLGALGEFDFLKPRDFKLRNMFVTEDEQRC